MKISARTKGGKLCVRVRLALSEQFGSNELDLLQKRAVIGLLKPKQLRKRLAEYTGPAAESLQSRLKRPVTKGEFLLIMAQLTEITRKLRANNLFTRSIILDARYVFITEATNELEFLYVPLSTAGYVEADFLGFISSLVYDAKPVEGQNGEFISRFAFMLRGLDMFNADAIDAYIATEDRTIAAQVKHGPLDGRPTISDKPAGYPQRFSEQDDWDTDTGLLSGNGNAGNDDDFPTGFLNGEEDTGFFGFEEDGAFDTGAFDTGSFQIDTFGSGSLGEDAFGGQGNNTRYGNAPFGTGQHNTVDVDPPHDDGGTDFLDVTPMAQTPMPTTSQFKARLTRVLNGEEVRINKPVFRLGKERSYVDYFVSDNNAVSRSHADIIIRAGRYYIRDLNSKNRTFINGSPIVPELETEISDGDRIKLANEEFIFHT